jgi:hypothetical protein
VFHCVGLLVVWSLLFVVGQLISSTFSFFFAVVELVPAAPLSPFFPYFPLEHSRRLSWLSFIFLFSELIENQPTSHSRAPVLYLHRCPPALDSSLHEPFRGRVYYVFRSSHAMHLVPRVGGRPPTALPLIPDQGCSRRSRVIPAPGLLYIGARGSAATVGRRGLPWPTPRVQERTA